MKVGVVLRAYARTQLLYAPLLSLTHALALHSLHIHSLIPLLLLLLQATLFLLHLACGCILRPIYLHAPAGQEHRLSAHNVHGACTGVTPKLLFLRFAQWRACYGLCAPSVNILLFVFLQTVYQSLAGALSTMLVQAHEETISLAFSGSSSALCTIHTQAHAMHEDEGSNPPLPIAPHHTICTCNTMLEAIQGKARS